MSEPSDAQLGLRQLILDRDQPTDGRVRAIAELNDAVLAKETLLQLCDRHDEPEELLRSAGRALGRLVEAGTSIFQFDMRDMSDVAFDAFCDG